MANNLTGGYGLRPIGITGSGPNSTGLTKYEIASNYTTAIYSGGIVVPASTGTIIITDQAIGRDQITLVLTLTFQSKRLSMTIRHNFTLWQLMARILIVQRL